MAEKNCHVELHEFAKTGNLKEFMDYINKQKGIEQCNCVDDQLLEDGAFGGDIKIIEYLLSTGADINKVSGDYKIVPIFWAFQEGHFKAAKFLFQNGAKIELTDSTANKLPSAAAKGQKNVVEYLLITTANVDEMIDSDLKITALCLAAFFGHLDIVKLLVEAGADINHSDLNKNTPLIYAINGDNLDIVKYLIDKGCDLSVLNKTEHVTRNIILSLFETLQITHSLFVDEFRGHKDNEYRSNPIQTSNLSAIKYLTRRNIDAQKHTSISRAALGGDLYMLDYLATQGFNVNELDSDGNTPLINAIKTRNESVVRKLISYDADICRPGLNGRTPLVEAVEIQNLPLVEYLLDNGALPTVQTAFLVAIQIGNLEIIKRLEQKGGDINFIYQNGQTPLSKAIDLGNMDIARYLVESGADPNAIINQSKNPYLMKYVTERNIEIVKFFVELGVKLDVSGDDGFTPVTKSVETDNFQLVKYFLENGADVNFKDGNKKTALSIAASKGYFSICKLLIEAKAGIEDSKSEVLAFSRSNEDFAIYLRIQKSLACGSGDGAGHESESEKVKNEDIE